MTAIKQIIRQIFTLDLRSLAIMRIVSGILIIINLIILCSSFEAFVSDYGIFPASTALSQYPTLNYRGFHVISGSYRRQVPLFIIHFLVAIGFTLGYQTRASTILLRIFTCSLQGSQHLFLHGGDTVTRLLLFRSIFLPIGEWYSIDGRYKQEKMHHIYSISSFALIIQIISIYIVSVALKTDQCRSQDFTSIYYNLGIDYYSTKIGIWLRGYSQIISYMSAYVYYLERIGPILYLLPNKKIKTSVCLLFITFHLGLAVFMHLGLFPRICISVWIGLMPYRHKQNEQLLYYRVKKTEYTVLALITLVILRNINTLYPQFLGSNFSKFHRYYYLLRLDQSRGMFAPSPSFSNSWHQIDGIYFNNNKVNLSNPDSAPYTEKPSHDLLVNILPNSKWTRMGLTLNKKTYAHLRMNRAMYLCRKRNSKQSPENQIKAVQIQYHRQTTLTGYTYGETQTNNRGTWDCPR